ncbi:hypothetical protein [Streptomyces sp. NPDC059009]|uniref:hypothetical protein n=1 Tax=Streptomyces sp. NPDC059009 TaxID=3346694 RepID=UPI0036AE0EAF
MGREIADLTNELVAVKADQPVEIIDGMETIDIGDFAKNATVEEFIAAGESLGSEIASRLVEGVNASELSDVLAELVTLFYARGLAGKATV